MQIKISKSQWQEMGKKAGWMKTAAGEGETEGGMPGMTNTPPPRTQPGLPQTPTQQTSPSPQYISESEQWANSTKDPHIIEFVPNVNHKAQMPGGEKWQPTIALIMKAMKGDKTAYQQILQQAGGQAIPIK